MLLQSAYSAIRPALFNNGLAASMISTAAGKVSLSFGDAFLRGIACNFLVCIAVWISFAAKQVSSKIIGLFFPIMMFVLCGFEHSVANMYYIAAGIFAKGNAPILKLQLLPALTYLALHGELCSPKIFFR